MNVAYRNEGDVQPADSDGGQVGVVDVTDTRVAFVQDHQRFRTSCAICLVYR